MKKSLIFILSFLFFHLSFAASWETQKQECEYKDKVKECRDALKSWTSRDLDYICNPWTDGSILMQIILDEKFKKIDKEVEWYIKTLESNKARFFWPSSSESLVEWVDEIEKKLWAKRWSEFYDKYIDICWVWIIKQAADCEWWLQKVDAADFFKDSTCEALVQTKMTIANQVAYNVIALNKAQVAKDLKKTSFQNRKTKYDKLLDLVILNISYIERIRQKWPSKTKKPM